MDLSWIHGLAAIALAISSLSLLSSIWRLVGLGQPKSASPASVTLILPMTGAVPGLEALVAALNAQSLQPRRLIAALESEQDPAWARMTEVAPSARFPIEFVAGGEAVRQAQKCRNQQAALERIDASDDAIVLMDADILPQPWWLSGLVSPLVDGTADVVSGRRWQRVEGPMAGAHLVAAIDRAIMLLPRLGFRRVSAVWGGSVATTPAAAARMDLQGALSRTLSDDLSIAESAENAELRILTRGALLVPSPSRLGLAAAFRFGVRQYRISHIYRPWLWRLACLAVGFRLAAWAVLLTQAFLIETFWFALAGLAGLATLNQILVGEIARRVGLPDPPAVRLVQTLLGPLQVLVDLFHFGVVVAAARTTPLVWSHVVYDIAAPDEIKVTRRLAFRAD